MIHSALRSFDNEMTGLDSAMNNGGLTLFGAHIYLDTHFLSVNPIWQTGKQVQEHYRYIVQSDPMLHNAFRSFDT